MKIQQPNEIPIRRNYLPALKVEYSSSAHQKSFRIQIYRIQVSLVKKTWICHVSNLIVLTGFYVSASQSSEILGKSFWKKTLDNYDCSGKTVHLPCFFLWLFFTINKKVKS